MFNLGGPLVGNLGTLRIFFPFPDILQHPVFIESIQTPPLSSQLSSVLIPNTSEDLLSWETELMGCRLKQTRGKKWGTELNNWGEVKVSTENLRSFTPEFQERYPSTYSSNRRNCLGRQNSSQMLSGGRPQNKGFPVSLQAMFSQNFLPSCTILGFLHLYLKHGC